MLVHERLAEIGGVDRTGCRVDLHAVASLIPWAGG
jgi:hypothetical protein